ncbi:MAG: translation elongation factor 4 [Candidatus Omnitrophica bacterium]|nr:translation elongation factor 4 [Candidatus Omnitrophota bacterium]
MVKQKNIRNFAIIAHIDHGKSTLADRFIERSTGYDERKFSDQMLDSMELEKERGITIKAKAVRLNYTFNSEEYVLNLIDTPGHVDFAYEVAKSLKACEGAILLVDASQGVEAQTVANFYLTLDTNLKVIPVLNKIDLPGSDVERTKTQLEEIFGFKRDEMLTVSAKEGTGVKDVIEAVIRQIPPPEGNPDMPLKAMLFDSLYDSYKGVVLFLRIFDGTLLPGDTILLMHQDVRYKVDEIGAFLPHAIKVNSLSCGEVGFIGCNIKDPMAVDVGDTVTLSKNPTKEPFKGYKKLPPMVFCGIFPSTPKDYAVLRGAIEKLRLSDPSFVYEPDNLGSLGYGFRCGFLGMLHMEVITERLEREFDLSLILTAPNVMYEVKTKKGEIKKIDSPHHLPDPTYIEQVYEPFVRAFVVTPVEGMEPLCDLSKSRRGQFINMEYLGKDRLNLTFELPLSEIIVDFYDKIKSLTKGYASLDYEFIGYRPTEIVKVDILFNRNQVEAFSLLVHKDKAETKSRAVVSKLRELLPRQMFEVHIQASIGSRVVASEKIGAMKKNVTAKCYGGDISRKRKLWEKQKKGKQKMKQLGNVNVPQEAFLEVLRM